MCFCGFCPKRRKRFSFVAGGYVVSVSFYKFVVRASFSVASGGMLTRWTFPRVICSLSNLDERRV